MEFKKGNKSGRGGARPGAGRKKDPTTLLKEAINSLDSDIPAIFAKLKELCLKEGDTKACMYLCDRRLGKPIAAINLEGRDKAVEILSQIKEAMLRPDEPGETESVLEG